MLLVTTITPQDCSCPSTAPSPPGPLSDNVNYLLKNEIADGVDYGVPIVLGSLIFLKADFEVDESLESLEAACPTGWRAPTLAEYQSVITFLGGAKLAYAKFTTVLNMQAEYSYMASDKSYPGNIDSTNNDAWNFKGLYVDDISLSVTAQDINTYWEPYKAVKCVMDNSNPIGGRSSDMYVNQSYTFNSLRSNLVSLVWQYDTTQSTDSSISLSFPTPGCHTIQSWGKNLLNVVLYSCKNVFVVSPFGSDGNSVLTATTVSSINLATKARPNNTLFFSPSISPIAPKPNGGFYLSYVGYSDNMLYVIEYDANMVQLVKKNMNLSIVPMDILALSWGFVIFGREYSDTSNGFLIAFNSDFTQKWKRVIQNNGPTPTTVTEQMTFYDPAGAPISGNEMNYAIGNGKLAFGQGRISLVYGRYNHFGMLPDGVTRNDHTGDGYLTFDENGQNEKYSWIWLASHSLYQAHLYNGQFFATAALGDDYPQNIQVCIVDQSVTDGYVDGVRNQAIRHPKYCTTIAPGTIPGDGKGNTCGRLGGLHYINGTYAVVYQRKPCKLLNQSTAKYVSQTLNELALLTFTFNPVKKTFSSITKKVLVSVTDLIMSVRSGKYGNKIFITYASQKTSNGSLTSNNNFYLGTDTTKYMLVGIDGVIATAPLAAPLNSTPLSDDLKYLQDGRLVWSFIDFNQNLFIYYTNPPPLVQNTSFVETKKEAKAKNKFLAKK